MLLFADFFLPLTLPTPPSGTLEEAGWRGAGRTREGFSVLLPAFPSGSPGATWDQGTERMSAEGRPPPQAGPTPGAEAERRLPASLPPSLSGNVEKTGSGKLSPPAGWWEGEGAALQFPPDQQSRVWGHGEGRTRMGPPAPSRISDTGLGVTGPLP